MGICKLHRESVNLISTNGATLYITGVQLEAGEQASGFEFMPVDADLLRCQRYYYQIPTLSGGLGAGFFLAFNAT
jgi:hypothetical protein